MRFMLPLYFIIKSMDNKFSNKIYNQTNHKFLKFETLFNDISLRLINFITLNLNTYII